MDEQRKRRSAARAAPSGREAIVLFDGAGDVVFASPELSDLFPGEIHRQADLEDALHLQRDAALRDAESSGGDPNAHPLESPTDASGRRLRLTVHAIELSAGDGDPVRLVVARDVPSAGESGVLREAFARILAHELRTPVTSIYGGAQLMADASISEDTRREAALTVATEAERLYRTVEDLLILARFDEPLDLGDTPELLQRFLPAVVRNEASRFADVSFVAKVGDDLPAVRGRQAYVEQVFRHLLASAARFSPPGSTVRLTAAPKESVVEIRIVDGGPSIGREEAATMFDLFSRTPRTAGDASGANLGLFVARRLVVAMGGQIRALAARRPTVVVTLPIVPVED